MIDRGSAGRGFVSTSEPGELARFVDILRFQIQFVLAVRSREIGKAQTGIAEDLHEGLRLAVAIRSGREALPCHDPLINGQIFNVPGCGPSPGCAVTGPK